jgi:ADP-ribose pyrophosphatase YjhB (NUDIX family)
MANETEAGKTFGATPAPNYIRPLAICVFRRDDRCILVAPGYDAVKRQHFYRPLGGGIDFMERAEDAARREIKEELGTDVEIVRLLGISENIFTYLGRPGHELVWTYEARFQDQSFYARDVLLANESGTAFEVRWVPLALFENGEAPLYPDGLLALLSQ